MPRFCYSCDLQLNNDLAVLPCGHLFHFKWYKSVISIYNLILSHCPKCNRACTCKCITKIVDCDFGGNPSTEKSELKKEISDIDNKLIQAKQKYLCLQSTYSTLEQTLQNERKERNRLKCMHMPSCLKDPLLDKKSCLREELAKLGEEVESAEQKKGQLIRMDNIISSGNMKEFSKWANMIISTKKPQEASNELYNAYNKLIIQCSMIRRDMKASLLK